MKNFSKLVKKHSLLIPFLVFFILFVLTLSLKASTDKQISDWQSRINKILYSSKISKAHLGIFISDDSSGEKPIFSLNASAKIIPASVTKLVTSAVVLEELPPGTKFKTGLWSKAKVEKSHLKGDLYLKGGGDPSFVSENMWFLVNSFLRTRVNTIEGDIIVDDSLFDQSRFDSSRQEERVDRAYDAPTGAMSFNWNSVNIFIRPGTSSGEAAVVFADPENDYIQLKAQVKTSSAGSSNSILVEREARPGNEGDLVIVKGKIAADSKEVTVYKNITHPDLWSGFNLRSFLKQRGIEVLGKIRSGIIPAGANLLAESESKPVELILADMNKFSNNFVAEMLAKSAAAKISVPGNISRAMEMSRDYMKKLGIKESDFELQNPSGLTRDNRLTAFGLWKVLSDLEKRFQIQPELMTSLPIGGVDGTLKKRFKESAGLRQVRAKTGSLTGVVSMAGYLSGPEGHPIPFVMMYNGSDDESAVRVLFDKLCLAVIE